MELTVKELKSRAITKDELQFGIEISRHANKSVLDLLMYKTVYVVGSSTGKYEMNRFLPVLDGRASRRKGDLLLWNEKGYYEIDGNDLFFTEEYEAKNKQFGLENPSKFFCVKAGENKKVWNLVIQYFDVYGKEVILKTFIYPSKEKALHQYQISRNYDTSMGWEVDEEKPDVEYTATKDGEVCRVLLQESYIYNQD